MGNELVSNSDRREFLKQAAGSVIAASMPARSYARIIGANDRIHLAQLGCGGRSAGHVHMVQLANKQTPVETIAVCDIWSLARDARAEQVKATFNLEPRKYKYSEEMLANKDIDGVMIATGDFQHAKLCADVVHAGKDCYVEKPWPFANVLSEAKQARDVVKASKQVVQMGTQHRSQPYPLAVRDLIRSWPHRPNRSHRTGMECKCAAVALRERRYRKRPLQRQRERPVREYDTGREVKVALQRR